MRARAALGLVVVAVLAAGQASAAAAAERLTEIQLSGSGTLTVAWHGDRAAGCEAAGMCGYSGTISYPGAPSADLTIIRRGHRVIEDLTGIVDMEGSAVVRVRREIPGSAPASCVDQEDSPGFTFVIARADRGRFRLGLGTDVWPAPMASGQCAGPSLRDFERSLPATTFKLRRLARKGARLRLRGRSVFRSGPIVGEVVSTLAFRSHGARTEPFGGPRPRPGRHPRRFLNVRLRYDITTANGAVSADFRAVRPPLCGVFDACGATGSERYAIASKHSTLTMSGLAETRGERVPRPRTAIRRVLRGGEFFGFAGLGRRAGETTGLFARHGHQECTDTRRHRGSPELIAFTGSGSRLGFSIGESEGVDAPGADFLRTRCPGPTQAQILRDSPMAEGHLSGGALVGSRMRWELSGGGRFSSGAYRGTRTGQFVVTLVRKAVRVRVVGSGGRP